MTDLRSPGIVDFSHVRMVADPPDPNQKPHGWAEDLAAAPASARERLASLQRDLAAATAATTTAEAACKAARAALLDARVTGAPTSPAQTALSSADAASAKAGKERVELQEVVAELERRLVAGVQDRRNAEAEAAIAAAHKAYDAGLAVLARVPEVIAAMRQAQADEAAGAQAKATARHEGKNGFQGFRPSEGRAYRTIPATLDTLFFGTIPPGGTPDPLRDVPFILGRRDGAAL